MDSGNLAGSLLTLQAGLLELKDEPVLSANAFHGLQDTLQVLAEQLSSSPTPDLAEKVTLLQDILSFRTLNSRPETLAAADTLLDKILYKRRGACGRAAAG